MQAAPIDGAAHHVFQLAGVPEQKIVARFWIFGAVCAALGLLLIKVR